MKNSTALVLILVSAALFYTFTDAQYQEVKKLRTEASEYKSVLRDAEAIAEKREALFGRYNEIPEAEVDRLEKVLPDNVDAVRLAYDLDTIAAEHGIAIKNVRIKTSEDDSASTIIEEGTGLPYEKVAVSFSFITDYDGLKNLLLDVEKSLRIIDVRAVTFRVFEEDLYEHEVTIETYWLK